MNKALEDVARRTGADLVGVADLSLLAGLETNPADLLGGYTRAVSLAVKVADGVMATIKGGPTPVYAHHYRVLNAQLDVVGLRVARFLEAQGASALPIPASLIVDRDRLMSLISHKAVAVAAGLAWQGKSLLAVTPGYGPRVRLTTVLTNAPLQAAKPGCNRCGACTACTEACPAQAIRNVNTQWHYQSREEAVDLAKCAAWVGKWRTDPLIGADICGVCVSVCPWGRPRKKGRPQGVELTA